MIEIGSTPTLSLVSTEGKSFDLKSNEGDKGVFVYFMRALSCAQCNAAVAKMAKGHDAFDKAGVRVVIAVPEDLASATAWKAKKALPFDVVVGQSGTAHEEVGLLRKVFGLLQQSGSILLDRDGVTRYAHVSTNPGASYNEAEVAGAIAQLA
ncbi:redoxin domain-containing protein [Glaciihabitans sp. dw_435]|uniref:redoxin domain-containing protein n=1 Tax=Glaciihabitans sp. dw_435 TaxID=2720081 RepID=UPI001BD53C4A|nr:redoxin domain-containing protein [Glaciihabitans sp. dw_435]